MLGNNFFRAAATAVALTTSAGFASAEQYPVVMYENGFFPELSFVKAGDVLEITNKSGERRDIRSRDGVTLISNISINGTKSLTIAADTPTEFVGIHRGYGSISPNQSRDKYNRNWVISTLDFNDPPSLYPGDTGSVFGN